MGVLDPRMHVRALAAVVAPERCVGCGDPGAALCDDCSAPLRRGARRSDPTPCPSGLPPTFAAAAYEGAVRSAVVDLKEHGRRELLVPLGAGLAAAVAAALLSAGADPAGPVLLVPVPSSPQAVRARGSQVTVELARSAARVLRTTGVPVRCWAGMRTTRRRLDQAGLHSAARAANLAGSLRAGPMPASAVPAGAVVVVDDVVTTGATLAEATRALRAAGCEVLGCAVVAATRRWSR